MSVNSNGYIHLGGDIRNIYILLLLSLLTPGWGQSVEIPHKMMIQDATLNIPIFIYNVSELEFIQLIIEYDESIILAEGIIENPVGILDGGYTFTSNLTEPGIIHIGIGSNSANVFSGSGMIVQITFKSIGELGEFSTLAILDALINSIQTLDSAVDGSIEIILDELTITGQDNSGIGANHVITLGMCDGCTDEWKFGEDEYDYPNPLSGEYTNINFYQLDWFGQEDENGNVCNQIEFSTNFRSQHSFRELTKWGIKGGAGGGLSFDIDINLSWNSDILNSTSDNFKMFIYVGESGYDMQQQNNITIPQSELTLNVNNEPNIWVKLGVCADTGETLTYYQDFDGDGLGSGISAQYCSGYEPDGWVTNSDDENDFCYSNVVDCNDDCDGTAVQDCLGICGGSATEDECGVCEGNGIADGACDCDGNVLDECGECGGDGIDECGICGGPGEVYCGGGIYECNEDDCPDTINYCLDLHEGANLISFYALPDDVSISHVMSSVEGNATGVIGEGVAANWNGTDWQGSINTISSLSGYWVIVSEACLLCIEDGTPTDPVIQYSLHSGANLISFPVEGSVEISFSLPDDIEGFVSRIIGEGVAADNQPPWQGSLSNLSGGNGYWMITTEDISFSFDVCADCGNAECCDIDGNCYETIQIGDQLWMAENLKVTKYRDGGDIPTGYSNPEWAQLETGAYAVYDDDPSNADIYGNLYNWAVVDDSRGLCMDGWHVPSDEEIMELEMELGMSESEANGLGWRGTDEGSQLAGNSDLWIDGNLENNSEFGTSGFNVLPAGYRDSGNGYCYDMGNDGGFWSSSEYNSYDAWYRGLIYYFSDVHRFDYGKQGGFSIRCLGD